MPQVEPTVASTEGRRIDCRTSFTNFTIGLRALVQTQADGEIGQVPPR
jgi:hypothetical protein